MTSLSRADGQCRHFSNAAPPAESARSRAFAALPLGVPRSRIFYFNIRGRIEPVRLIFEHLGLDYQDDRVDSLESWAQLKAHLPFGELPLYEDGAHRIVQSQAILRHVARMHGLCGETEQHRVDCEIAEEAIVDLREHVWRDQWRPDHVDTKDEFARKFLWPHLEALAKWREAHGSKAHWIDSRLTYVDFLAFAFLDELRAFFPDTLDASPSLRAFHAGFAELPGIAAYLSSERRPAAFGYAAHGLKMDPQRA